MSWKEGSEERIAAFIAGEFEEPTMLMSWVFIAETMTRSGEVSVALNSAEGQTATSTLGLLTYADVIERANVRRIWEEDEE